MVSTAAPTYSSSKWTFGTVAGYFLKAEAVDYEVTSTTDVTTLTATINMTAPANLVQVYVNESAPAFGNEYVLNMTNVKPFTFDGIEPGGAATVTTGTANFPMTAYSGTIGSDAGYYFWGILANASLGTTSYSFQLVEQNADKKYAISSKEKEISSKNLTGPTAIKLTGSSWYDNGKFVSLGYTDCPLWATGNLDKTNNTIVDPLEAGEYFMYGYTHPYNDSDVQYAGTENPLSTKADVAYQANNAWRMPTKAQFEAFFNSSNTSYQLNHDWTNLGSEKDAYLYTSKANGISLLFAAAGYYHSGSLSQVGKYANYWTSTPNGSDNAYVVSLTNMYSVPVGNSSRYNGYSVRPVKN